MSVHLKAVIWLLVLGLAAILGVRFLIPVLHDSQQRQTSDADATQGTLTLGMDNWIGYFPLCSPPMVKRMRAAGYLLRCENDDADYRARFERLKAGEFQFAVATVDSYLLAGTALAFPATIIAVIDESNGGDAIVARRDRADRLDALKQTDGIRIAYTPASPSEHLLRSIGVHFDIPSLTRPGGDWRVPTSGSSEALRLLLDGEVDAAALWEPDVTRALDQPDIAKLIGTDDTERLIVDILLVNRRFSQEQPAAVQALLANYFDLQRRYREHPAELRAEVVEATGLGRDQVDAMLGGVSWTTLGENGAIWFGIDSGRPFADEGLVEAIEGAIRILVDSGDLDANPLPNGDPYRITNRRFIGDLYQRLGAEGDGDDGGNRFDPLDDAGWARLKEIATLKMAPIVFRRGTADLAYDGKLALDRVAERLAHYPRFRILVKGHSGLRGDPDANLQLSRERAGAVVRYLLVTYGIHPNRVRAIGYGSSRPLPRLPGEPERAYRYRLPRVEVTLAAETL